MNLSCEFYASEQQLQRQEQINIHSHKQVSNHYITMWDLLDIVLLWRKNNWYERVEDNVFLDACWCVFNHLQVALLMADFQSRNECLNVVMLKHNSIIEAMYHICIKVQNLEQQQQKPQQQPCSQLPFEQEKLEKPQTQQTYQNDLQRHQPWRNKVQQHNLKNPTEILLFPADIKNNLVSHSSKAWKQLTLLNLRIIFQSGFTLE